ncbi:hypothetical protein ASZ90_007602 [hydrocarbon metagenome]|uniref:Uncharacterized protein n=1 Tax=hydrocarbon metagenome TaxID=938273 RepID=A0A0W8FPB0_9ZZZZ
MDSDNVATEIFGGGRDRMSQNPRGLRMSRMICKGKDLTLPRSGFYPSR